jgi:chemotaxis-related protein WspD
LQTALQTDSPRPDVGDCWNQIGVHGDKSCERLAEVTHCRNCPVFSAAGDRLLHRAAPAGYLAEWTARLAPADLAAKRAEHSVLIFRVGNEWLALETRLFIEVTEQRAVHRIPHCRNRALLAGLTNVRGRLEICVSLRALLGVNGEEPRDAGASSPRSLVVEHQQKRWVLPVDEVHGIHAFHSEDVTAAPATVARGQSHVRGLLPWGERKVGFLDPDKLFPALELGLR